MQSNSKGAVSAGSIEATKAGIEMLERGGNAFDAAVATQFAAFVSEPLLTGVAGAGLATIRKSNGEVFQIDFFSTMPGLGQPNLSPNLRKMSKVEINFGPTTQRFDIGIGSVATPTMMDGISYLINEHCSLDKKTLVQPALNVIKSGAVVTAGFERVLELLWPIVTQSKSMMDIFSINNRPLRSGDRFHFWDIEDTLKQYSQRNAQFWSADLKIELNNLTKNNSLLTAADIEEYETLINKLQGHKTSCGEVYIPQKPSIGGVIIKSSLRELQSKKIRKFGPVIKLLSALKQGQLQSEIETPSWYDETAGYTTHLSTIDRAGNSCGITSSLGETAGVMIPNTGIILNNFLGEKDVAPSIATRTAGKRLLTMCAPIIYVQNENTFVMGSGGSSRISSAIINGLEYAEQGLSLDEIVNSPRCHYQENEIHLEIHNRSNLEEIEKEIKELFDMPIRVHPKDNMFFGGLNSVSLQDGIFFACGDYRRSGVGIVA